SFNSALADDLAGTASTNNGAPPSTSSFGAPVVVTQFLQPQPQPPAMPSTTPRRPPAAAPAPTATPGAAQPAVPPVAQPPVQQPTAAPATDFALDGATRSLGGAGAPVSSTPYMIGDFFSAAGQIVVSGENPSVPGRPTLVGTIPNAGGTRRVKISE